MESELRVALDNNQIKPYFQPIVRLDTLEVVGFEALARWIHPERGMIPPIEFIPVAEDTGLIGRLSSCLLETSMKELAKLRKVKQADFYVSVNVSARQTRDWTLLQDIERLLEETGLDGAALNLEITESLLLEEFSAAQTLMETARERWGTRVAIDDFGTGYSSLSYLKKLPFDSLKIDRSFVKELPDDSDDAVITQAIVAMAHALGKELIAEGIENSEQLAYLKSLGCEFGQGYLFGKPAEISTFFDQGGPVELDKAS
jgi:EAL domain-containing protein (putative c-di-GMP-specific phosphodiesterase class I)